jgi:ankyrin repeat protein
MTDPTALFDAIRAGDSAQVQSQLTTAPALATASLNGVSAILLALYHGQERIARHLAQQAGELGFFEAAALGDTDRVSRLLTTDPSLAEATTPDGYRGLGLAAFFGQEQVVALLARWCDPNIPSANAMRVTPLHSAMATRKPEAAVGLARALLAQGADPNRQQEGGWTPLHAAAQSGDPELVSLLLAHGAQPDIANDAGETPADLAAAKEHIAVLALLKPL